MKRIKKIVAVTALLGVIALSMAKDVHAAKTTGYPALGSFYDMSRDVVFEVTYEAHRIFNKYDVDIYLDDRKIGTIFNAATFTGTGHVMPGTHKLTFKKVSDGSVSGSINFEASEDQSFSCSIDCEKKEIFINNVKQNVSKGGGSVEYPWRYDAVIAKANDYIYGKIIKDAEMSGVQYDCFTVFNPDEKILYVFVKCDSSINHGRFAELNGHELGKILSSAGLDSGFIFADMSGKYVEEYDSKGRESELKTLSNWKEKYLKEYW